MSGMTRKTGGGQAKDQKRQLGFFLLVYAKFLNTTVLLLYL